MIKITLKDGIIKKYQEGVTVREVAESISAGLARAALAGEVDGRVTELDSKLESNCRLNLLTFDDEGGRLVYRHTASHVLAQAVKRLYPDVKLAIGPAIDSGYYYDFEREKPFSIDELESIEKEMEKIIKEDLKLERFSLPRNEAIKFMEEKAESYKVELIKDLPEGEEISFYKQGDFTDLCAGPHLSGTVKLKAIKLLSVAGAYWRGNEKNKMLQRIYGTAFPKKSQLDEYLFRMEEAKKRDHRKLGRELDLFDILDEGPGFPFFMPKGMVLRNLLEDFWRSEHKKAGYQEIKTPVILNKELWLRSGHWDTYKENMYTVDIDEQEYAIKPMNCPGGILVFKRKLHSYRDLPQRMGELGLVHRHELSGALHGLMRVRCFTQDDAHIFMTPEQITDEIVGVINLIDDFYKVFGFKYNVELSTRPENSIGSDEMWELSTQGLRKALDLKGIKYTVNEGDGAFYGPKIDFHLEDSIGRTWQCGTIQLDMNLPERFDLSYIGPDGEKHRPVMIHRVVFGSIERFIAILTEHFAGAFPAWLSPVQVKILPLVDKHHDYAFEVKKLLEAENVRVEVDSRNEKIGYKIREAQMDKTPYMLVIGDKELEGRLVSVRSRRDGDLGAISPEQFAEKILDEIKNKLK
ncbi:threonyl-tRNA synthetase [Ruminiclostridium papyrosolvens DSM 2782]|uniref:Threonine--tRNA ligase n=1 Tax=Ruminiclostridium papyrosolvens DSM 2782 TaxID=588581 RepID=F1T9B7_9FIRM|nr:threonine--tRNA ligase [Ruminiclostridium papyrosolvens]EGD49099.1 threonyl-tRNA synthetase [Ruminiclostridium papyrosolvens DSM 2782]WES35580.1 threonine--tRNA ligase [Ruminiclostridium papyrosolvens DSM 2782]